MESNLESANAMMLEMKIRLGLLGCGKLGKSFLRGILKTEIPLTVIASVQSQSSLESLQKEFPKFLFTTENPQVIQNSDYIFLGVKPLLALNLLKDNLIYFHDKHHLISFCARLSVSQIAHLWVATNLSQRPAIHRLMANTFMEKQVGLFGHTGLVDLPLGLKNIILELGTLNEVNEAQFDAFTTLSASAPAFVFEFLKGLKDFSESQKIPNETLQQILPQILKGAASMIEEGESIDSRIQQIATQGGMTAAGLEELRVQALTKTVAKACSATLDKALSFKL